MRIAGALFAGWLLLSCYGSEAPGVEADVCEHAKYRVATCGFALPTLEDDACTGAARLLARCVVDHAADCDELATLTQRIDVCAQDLVDGGGLVVPPSDLPVPDTSRGDGGR